MHECIKFQFRERWLIWGCIASMILDSRSVCTVDMFQGNDWTGSFHEIGGLGSMTFSEPKDSYASVGLKTCTGDEMAQNSGVTVVGYGLLG